jgi:hypothetical protein
MFFSLALAALTSVPTSHQGGDLKLTNVRMTIGELGPTRPSNKLLPGDVLFIGYDINGLTIADDGRAKYKMGMQIVNSEGKAIFAEAPRELPEEFFLLRGNTIPARAFVTIGLDQDPGIYTCKITVEDPKTKSKDELTTKFEVLKKEFGIVAVFTSHDYDGKLVSPTTGMVGQGIFVQFSVASFERDPKTKQPIVELEFQVLDDKGNPILGKPGQHTQDDKAVSQVAANAGAFAMRFPLFMSRPGKFTIRITAEDKVAKKKSTYELPITILPNN